MGRPIASVPAASDEAARAIIRFARRWLVGTVAVSVMAFVLDTFGGPRFAFAKEPALIATYVAIVGCFVIWIAYAPRPTRRVLYAGSALGLAMFLGSGIVAGTWQVSKVGFGLVAVLLAWTTFRTVFDLWFREDQIIRDRKPRAVWPERRA